MVAVQPEPHWALCPKEAQRAAGEPCLHIRPQLCSRPTHTPFSPSKMRAYGELPQFLLSAPKENPSRSRPLLHASTQVSLLPGLHSPARPLDPVSQEPCGPALGHACDTRIRLPLSTGSPCDLAGEPSVQLRAAFRCAFWSPTGRTPPGAPAAAGPRAPGAGGGGACPRTLTSGQGRVIVGGCQLRCCPEPSQCGAARRQGGGGMKHGQDRKQSQQVTWQVQSELCNESRGMCDAFRGHKPLPTPRPVAFFS